MRCCTVGCSDDQVQCPNFDNVCKYRSEYVLCTSGFYRGRCLAASAACEDLDKCFDDTVVHYCSELLTIFNDTIQCVSKKRFDSSRLQFRQARTNFDNFGSTASAYFQQEVKVIWQKAPHGEPIPRLGVTPGGRNLYHWIPGVGVPISVP